MVNDKHLVIRPAAKDDTDEILSMMIELAIFEGYKRDFKLTKIELIERLFERKDFSVLIAEYKGCVAGILVFYTLPFTYDLAPWVYIKELFIKADYRFSGIGKKLLSELARRCVFNGHSKIRWDVLSNNLAAQKFYFSIGAKEESHWKLFSLDSIGIAELANK